MHPGWGWLSCDPELGQRLTFVAPRAAFSLAVHRAIMEICFFNIQLDLCANMPPDGDHWYIGFTNQSKRRFFVALIEEAADAIRKAIAAIDAEREQLSKVLDSLNGRSPTGSGIQPPARRSAVRKTRKSSEPGAKGSRRQEVLASINRKPGMTGTRLAKELSIPASEVDEICGTLVKEKSIRKRGTTYEPMPGAPATGGKAPNYAGNPG